MPSPEGCPSRPFSESPNAQVVMAMTAKIATTTRISIASSMPLIYPPAAPHNHHPVGPAGGRSDLMSRSPRPTQRAKANAAQRAVANAAVSSMHSPGAPSVGDDSGVRTLVRPPPHDTRHTAHGARALRRSTFPSGAALRGNRANFALGVSCSWLRLISCARPQRWHSSIVMMTEDDAGVRVSMGAGPVCPGRHLPS
jgi:hypothetical protein